MIPTTSHTLSDVDETLTALTIREKLENGTYKEIAKNNG
jgi:glycine C-acetyltransferase